LRKFTHEEWTEINDKIHSTSGQAYLALKGLTDEENNFSFYHTVNPQNYSLNSRSLIKTLF
jgi:hypothetical protein